MSKLLVLSSLSALVVYLLCAKYIFANKYLNTPSYIFFNIVVLVKYIVLPLFIALFGIYYVGKEPTISSVYSAIVLSFFEYICVIICVIVFAFRNLNLECNTKTNYSSSVYSSRAIYFTLIILICFIVFDYSHLLAQLNYFNKDTLDNDLDVKIDNKFALIQKFSSILLIITIIKMLMIKFLCVGSAKAKPLYLFLYISLVYFAIMNVSNSRWNFIFPFIALFYVYIRYIGPIPKYIKMIMISISLFLFVYMSLSKFSWLANTPSAYSDLIELFSFQLQDYFSGPWIVAQAIDMYDVSTSKFSFMIFINDIVGSIPSLSNLIDQRERTNVYFNEYVLGLIDQKTQIIPMIGLGYIYLGVMLSPFFTVLFVYLGLFFNKKAYLSKHPENTYLAIIGSLWCFMSIAFNTQIIIGNLIFSVMFVFVCFKIWSFFIKLIFNQSN